MRPPTGWSSHSPTVDEADRDMVRSFVENRTMMSGR